jgi:hypothetical protein
LGWLSFNTREKTRRPTDFVLEMRAEGILMRKSQARLVLLGSLIVLAGFTGFLPAYGQAKKPSRNLQPGARQLTSESQQNGPYFALVIGNNKYRYTHSLETAINDANAMDQLLRERYGFQTKVLLDATRDDIITALVKYRRELSETSNLLIYYAGHGHHDRDTDEAYWLPVDARPDNPENWVSADDITRNIRAIPSKHILIISDSCYSGVLTRDAPARIDPSDRGAYLARMLGSKSRTLMSSGSDEPVADSGAAGHSVFANAVLESLRRMNESRFTAGDLFQQFIQPRVAGQSAQLPQYSVVRESGHDFGDFVFSKIGVVPTPVGTSTLFVGTWLNDDPNTRSIPKFVIEQAGTKVSVHAFGACHPTYCDWGTQDGTVEHNTASLTWNQGFVVRSMKLTVNSPGHLSSATDSAYSDNRGRKSEVEYFHSEGVQQVVANPTAAAPAVSSQPGAVVRNAACTNLGSAQFRITASGDAYAPVGETHILYMELTVTKEGNGIRWRPDCGSWTAAQPADTSIWEVSCIHRPNDSPRTTWAISRTVQLADSYVPDKGLIIVRHPETKAGGAYSNFDLTCR